MMNRFLKRLVTLAVLFIGLNVLILIAIPKDANNYLCEYNHKIDLLSRIPQPRLIILGGSSVAFGTDSKTIADSLHCNVINFGLHGGIGIKYPLEDCLHYIKKGDVVVLQVEYENFFESSDGEPETFSQFMIATDWRRVNRLNYAQLQNIFLGIPNVTMGKIIRLIKYPFTKSWDTHINNSEFKYTKSGFNEYGDEVSHFKYPSKPDKPTGIVEKRNVDHDFCSWMSNILKKYKEAGADVIMLPPVCPRARFYSAFSDKIVYALKEMQYPYIVSPYLMALDDSCSFGGYHVNKEGVKQNTKHIIDAIRDYITLSK